MRPHRGRDPLLARVTHGGLRARRYGCARVQPVGAARRRRDDGTLGRAADRRFDDARHTDRSGAARPGLRRICCRVLLPSRVGHRRDGTRIRQPIAHKFRYSPDRFHPPSGSRFRNTPFISRQSPNGSPGLFSEPRRSSLPSGSATCSSPPCSNECSLSRRQPGRSASADRSVPAPTRLTRPT